MDDNLQSVADLVSQEIAGDSGSGMSQGFLTQEEINAQEGSGTPTSEPQQPTIPETGTQGQTPPSTPSISPVKAGDTVVDSTTSDSDQAATDNSLVEQLNDIFPGRGFSSLDDVKAANLNEALTNAEKATLRAKELEESNNDYQAKLSQKLNVYANDDIAQLNAFTQETGVYNPELFNKLKNLDVATADPLDMMVMKERKDNPDLSESEVRDYLKHKYNLNPKSFDHIFDEDERDQAVERNKEDIRIATISLKRDANAARSEFSELKAKIQPVDLNAQLEANKQATEQKIAEATESWNPHIAKSIDEIRNFNIDLPGEDGVKKTVATFNVPDDKLQEYRKHANQFAINNGIPADEAGKSAVNKFISDMVLIDFKDQIIQKAVSAAKASMEEEIDRTIVNPSGTKLPPNPTQVTPRPVGKTPDQIEDEIAEGALGILNRGDY